MQPKESSYLVFPVNPVPPWRAKWIAPEASATRINYYFRARRLFSPGHHASESILHITAESGYVLYVNGIRVGSGPVRGTCTCNFIDSYELATLLRPEGNWIAAEVCCYNVPSYRASPAQPGLFAQLGERMITDDSWEVLPATDWRPEVPKFTPQMGFIEWRDLRCEPLGWQTGLDNLPWQAARVIDDRQYIWNKELKLRDIPDLNVTRYQPTGIPFIQAVPPLADPQDTNIARIMTEEPHLPYPEELPGGLPDMPMELLTPPNTGGTALIVDFGREINGGFEMDIETTADAILDVGYEEMIRGDRLRLVFDQYGFDQAYQFADRYILRPGRQLLKNSFTERGYRYLQLACRHESGSVRLHRISAWDKRYPAEPRATFQCDDPLLNEIWTGCLETLSACTTDVFVDCPWRENAFWVNDCLVENLFWLQAFGDGRVNRRAILLALSQQREDGMIPGVCPYDGKPNVVLVATNLFLPLILSDYLNYTGDRSLVTQTIDRVLSVLEVFKAWENDNGLGPPPGLYWNFIDWSYPFKGIDLQNKATAILSWIYVLSLKTAGELLERLGRVDEASGLAKRAATIALKIDRGFWVPDERRYAEWMEDSEPSSISSQLAHAVALLSRMAPSHREAELIRALDRRDLLTPELYMQHIVLSAMAAHGHATEALDRIRSYWGPIVQSGSPTIWEANVHEFGKEAFGGAGSLCHGFACTPINFFQTVILGIRPTADGFTQFEVNPQPAGLKQAEGKVPTPGGQIEIAWQTTDDHGLAIELSVPPGTTAYLSNRRKYDTGYHRITLK